MPKRPSFKPLPTPDGWMVSIPESMSGTGKRKKRYFTLEKEADKFAAKLRTDYHAGLRGGTISPELASMAAAAARLLEPHGVTLMEAAQMAVRQMQPSSHSESFRERWERYQREQEEHWGTVYKRQISRMRNWLSDDFMALPVSAISHDTITIELKRYAKSTRKLYTTMVNAVLSERGKRQRASKVEILSREQLARLKWASRKDPETRRAVGLLLYAGVRPDAEDGEIKRLDWSDVGEEIYISAEVSKTNTDRHIPICRRLRWWIRGHPEDGPVVPSGWKRKWTRLRAAAGISDKKDIARHTFASNFLVVHGEDKTKAALGHTRGSGTLFAHYRRSVTERDARLYFGLASPHKPQ